MQVPPAEATTAMDSPCMSKDKDALPSEIGRDYVADSPLLERFRMPKESRGGHRGAPPSPKNASDSATRATSKRDVAMTPPT